MKAPEDSSKRSFRTLTRKSGRNDFEIVDSEDIESDAVYDEAEYEDEDDSGKYDIEGIRG